MAELTPEEKAEKLKRAKELYKHNLNKMKNAELKSVNFNEKLNADNGDRNFMEVGTNSLTVYTRNSDEQDYDNAYRGFDKENKEKGTETNYFDGNLYILNAKNRKKEHI